MTGTSGFAGAVRRPRFLLVDRQLLEVGGHHFEYAVDVLEAAESAGFEPVLAVHRDFSALAALPLHWSVLPTFRFGWEAKHWLGPFGGRHVAVDCNGRELQMAETTRSLAARLIAWKRSIQHKMTRRNRERHIIDFADGCAAIASQLKLGGHDHVLLPSMSEFDLLGLVRFLRSHPATQEISWHVQFHFGVFRGRIPDYAAQFGTAAEFRGQIAYALGCIPDHRLFFYATSEAIADQYNRLGILHCEPVPFPVNRRIGSGSDRLSPDRRPLRITCAGSWRREKGNRELSSLIEELWPNHLSGGQVQLVFQGGKRDLRRYIPARFRQHVQLCNSAEIPPDTPLAIVRHPLPVDQYTRLIRESDIGLFLYDSERYFARCSGGLVEMLAAGTPVVVPAACWLADQVEQPNRDHLGNLRTSMAVIDRIQPSSHDWRGHSQGGDRVAGHVVFADPRNASTAEIRVPAGAGSALVSFRWDPLNTDGVYVRLRTSAYAASNGFKDWQDTSVVNVDGSDQVIRLPFPLGPDIPGRKLRIRLENAFHDTAIQLNDFQVSFHSIVLGHSGGEPTGAVGLIAGDVGQTSKLVDEMIRNYPHYHRSAVQFSRTWRQTHDPMRTVERIQRNSRSADHPR